MLSVVIVNYHSSDFVRRSTAAVDPTWCERVVLVDNSNDPVEAERLASIRLPVPTKIIIEPSNVGFGVGANHGIDFALGAAPNSSVWLLNPDTEPAAGAPESLVRRLSLGLDDIVSPLVLTGDSGDERIWFAGGVADGRTGNVAHDDYLKPYDPTTIDEARPTTFMCGAAPVFTPEAWRRLRGFREDLFLYWEDVELSLRAQDLGLRMTVIRDASVWHAVGGTSDETGQSRNFYYYSARNRVRVMIDRGSGLELLRPRGLRELAKFALRPLRRERSQRLRKTCLALTGYVVGALSTRLSRDHHHVAVTVPALPSSKTAEGPAAHTSAEDRPPV
ncbi:glycosyltransferase family 2 protein [Curtobacterium flaccumfaciens]|uniref:glycosyltransferase family 2 protein n=1 Tax=Curtobacterium flaccumfaciens TaxID=2035 RepID=UPI001E5CAD46|nr:glycosyltransferase family 2 protein [Curtobacterium flaccumfaciens]